MAKYPNYLLAITALFATATIFLHQLIPEIDDSHGVLAIEEFRERVSSNTSTSFSDVSQYTVVGSQTPRGALDENGTPGYIHDPTFVRRNPLPFDFRPDLPLLDENVCDMPPGKGAEGFKGFRALRKIRIFNDTLSSPPTKVLCIIYTHSGAHAAVKAVVETYGQRCDGFMAASNHTDRRIGAVNILHQGPEAYKNMWQKVRSIWTYVYDNYLNDYDWFHIGGDNMYVIAENLRYAAHEETLRQQPRGPKRKNGPRAIYMGAAMVIAPMKRKWRLCGGGAGYTLNRQAVLQMVRDEFSQPHCRPDGETSEEDVLMSNCLRKNVALCTHNFDDLHEPRYHHFDVDFHATWKRGYPENWHSDFLLQYQGIDTRQERLKSISSSTVSFHLTDRMEGKTKFRDLGLRRYHAILYGLCPNHNHVPGTLNASIDLR